MEGRSRYIQEWSTSRRFPGRVVVEGAAGAPAIASEWRRARDTIWTYGSCLDNGEVGAACVWKSPGGWTGRRFHLGTNKVFSAEVFAISQALRVSGQSQESGHRYMAFVNSTAATDRVRTDAMCPG